MRTISIKDYVLEEINLMLAKEGKGVRLVSERPRPKAVDPPFGRQGQPVTVTIEGDPVDVDLWMHRLRRAAEFLGDQTHAVATAPPQRAFRIFPRAVND